MEPKNLMSLGPKLGEVCLVSLEMSVASTRFQGYLKPLPAYPCNNEEASRESRAAELNIAAF